MTTYTAKYKAEDIKKAKHERLKQLEGDLFQQNIFMSDNIKD